MQSSRNNKRIPVHPTPASKWREVQLSVGKDPKTDDFYVDCSDIKNLRRVGGVFINDSFLPLWNETKARIVFLAGGYGSSKTTYVITRLLEKCLNNEYFKCFYGRQKKVEARQLHSNIIREIKRNYWEEFFTFSEAPNGSPQILCNHNGNKFELFGCDDTASLKGWDNPTDILIDEINQISFESFGMMFTRLRTGGADLQLYGCFNNCDVYSDHWLRKYFYPESITAKPKNLENDPETKSKVFEELKKVKIIRHHSKYTDNFFINQESYYGQLAVQSGDDDERLRAYCDGDWGVALESQPFYKSFKRDTHIYDDVEYDPSLPLFLSFDENVNPYLPVLILQAEGNEIRIIDEITAENPYNTIDNVCEIIKERYGLHRRDVIIFGDATSKKDDVKMMKGENLYTIILSNLKMFSPLIKVPESNPNVGLRGDFINLVLGKKYQGLVIKIARKCIKTIEDFAYTQESPDPAKRGKYKEKTMVNGVRGVQKYGHLTDCFDYFICEEFMWAYLMFQNGDVSHEPEGGYRVVLNTMSEKPIVPLIVDEEGILQRKPAPERKGYYDDSEERGEEFEVSRYSKNRMN